MTLVVGSGMVEIVYLSKEELELLVQVLDDATDPEVEHSDEMLSKRMELCRLMDYFQAKLDKD